MARKIGGNNIKRRREEAHLLILQAPQAENCSRGVRARGSRGRREVEEDEVAEREPELGGMGIICADEEEKTEKKN